MKRAFLTIAVALTFVAGLSTPSRADNPLQKSSFGMEDLPPGEWSLTVGPSAERSLTVDVVSVLTEVKKGLAAIEVGVENKTDHNVSGVRLGWRLHDRANPKDVLLKGETPVLGVALSPKERRVVQYPVVTFAKIYRPLLRDGNVAGNYRIEIQVVDVIYESFTNRKRDKDDHPKFVRAGLPGMPETQFLNVLTKPSPPTQKGHCQNQACEYNFTRNCYTCTGEPRPGFMCKSRAVRHA